MFSRMSTLRMYSSPDPDTFVMPTSDFALMTLTSM
jgi:hypothetical protein